MRYYKIVGILLFLVPCFFLSAKTYTENDLKSQVYITWHLGADCSTNAPRILSFGVNKESTLCLKSGSPYQPLYFKLTPEKQTNSLSCAYNGGTPGPCSQGSVDHCTFKTADDQCVVKIKGQQPVSASVQDVLLKQPVLGSAVFDQYAPGYSVDSATTGVINLSGYHGMAIASDGKNDIVNETATLVGASAATPVKVTFAIDTKSGNDTRLVVLRFTGSAANQISCTITPTKQPDGSYAGKCSIPLIPNRFGSAVISATAAGYTIKPITARIGAYFTISSYQYVAGGKDTCYLNSKNINVTTAKPATGKDTDHYVVFKSDADGHGCTAGSEYVGINYPIVDETTGFITFSSGMETKPFIGLAQVNSHATSKNAVLTKPLAEVYNSQSGNAEINHYLRLNQSAIVDLIAIEGDSGAKSVANKFADFYNTRPLKPVSMTGYTSGYPYGEYLKDGAQSRYSNTIANLFCNRSTGVNHGCGCPSSGSCGDIDYTIQALTADSNNWGKLPLTGLTLDNNSFSFLTDNTSSPLFIYHNIIYLMVLEINQLWLYQYDDTLKKWKDSNIKLSVYKENLLDSSGKPFNPQFRITLGFNGDFYFPMNNPDPIRPLAREDIMRCNLNTKKCRLINMSRYWGRPELKDKAVIITNITAGIDNTIWVDFGMPAAPFGSKYFDSAFFKVPTDDGISPVTPTIITVPAIHAIKPTEKSHAPQVATDVYTNIQPSATISQLSKGKKEIIRR